MADPVFFDDPLETPEQLSERMRLRVADLQSKSIEGVGMTVVDESAEATILWLKVDGKLEPIGAVQRFKLELRTPDTVSAEVEFHGGHTLELADTRLIPQHEVQLKFEQDYPPIVTDPDTKMATGQTVAEFLRQHRPDLYPTPEASDGAG